MTKLGAPHGLLPGAMAVLLAGLFGCCMRPAIDVSNYAYLKEDPTECVRFFQLAVELGEWEEAAACLVAKEETVGPWELWLMSDMRLKELGDLSLNEIIVGTYHMQLLTPLEDARSEATVMILSRPTVSIDQRYDLVLLKRDADWVIDLDRTVELNS